MRVRTRGEFAPADKEKGIKTRSREIQIYQAPKHSSLHPELFYIHPEMILGQFVTDHNKLQRRRKYLSSADQQLGPT